MGQRPSFEAYQLHKREYVYLHVPGETSFTALKRGHKALQAQNAEEHEFSQSCVLYQADRPTGNRCSYCFKPSETSM